MGNDSSGESTGTPKYDSNLANLQQAEKLVGKSFGGHREPTKSEKLSRHDD